MLLLSMDIKLLKSTFLSLVFTFIITLTTAAFNDYSDKVLLSDVKALTLHQGQMTKARRSPPVPQLKCLGGSAQYKFTPKVVQCLNRGSDGYDVQWECKTDMDNSYRFGHVEVTCEGFDYPHDPYVLKGSCGLEYTIELTEEGQHREKQKGGNGYYTSYQYKPSSGGISGLFVFAGVIFVMYVIYKVFIAPNTLQSGPEATAPPPYGFRQEFMPNQGPPPSYDNFGSSYASQGFTSTGYTGRNGGGFWTGAASGGLLGYLLGRGNNYGSSWYGARPQQQYHYGENSSNTSGSFFSSPSGGGSSGTRTSSGFGGTSRR